MGIGTKLTCNSCDKYIVQKGDGLKGHLSAFFSSLPQLPSKSVLVSAKTSLAQVAPVILAHERDRIVKGGALKSMNQYYNKELARLRSVCTRSGQRTAKMIRRLSEKRNRKVRNALHHMSKLLVGHACRVGASAIVIGYNGGWKQKVRLGRRVNQGFVQIPYHALLRQIAYKSEENGIEVALQDESYKGRRICRGLFRSENGRVINADVNAAYNIIKKAFPKAFAEGIEDASLHPVRMAMCPMCE